MANTAQANIEHQISQRGDVTVLAIRGRLDAVRAGSVREPITSLPEQGHLKVTVDLSGLEWIDSSGVGVLVTLYKQARAHGGVVNVACLQKQPREIFRLLRLESAFQLFEAVDDAVAALG